MHLEHYHRAIFIEAKHRAVEIIKDQYYKNKNIKKICQKYGISYPVVKAAIAGKPPHDVNVIERIVWHDQKN